MKTAKPSGKYEWLPITILLLAIVAGAVFITLNTRPAEDIIITPPPATANTGSIYLGGAVANPGHYPLYADDTIDDLLLAAGGATTPKAPLQLIAATDDQSPQRIDINRADAWLLAALPGIGETRAADIVAYREQHDPFRATAEVMKVPGIGSGTYDVIKDLITVAE